MLPFFIESFSGVGKKNLKNPPHLKIGKLFLGVGVDRKIKVALKIKQGVGGNVCREKSRILYP